MAITFDSIGNGDLAEKFKIALQQVGKNIMNPNMDPDAAREITVNIKFKPVGQGTLNIDYNVKPKLAGFKKAKTVFLVGQDVRTGRVDMSEPGSRLPQVAPAQEIPPAAYEDVTAGRSVDPETGEIFEEKKGPIDLRRMQA